MFAVVITEKGGAQRRTEFDKTEVTIGRVQGNDIILPKGNVSKRHSRIVLKDNRFIVVDLKSTNGTYVNGRKITSPLVVKSGDKIYIGDFILTLEEPGGAAAMAPAPVAAASPPMGMGGPPPMGGPAMGPPPMGPPPMGPGPMGGPPVSQTLGGPGPMGPPMGGPAMGPPPMGGPAMGPPMGGPAMGPPPMGPPPLGGGPAMGPPPMAPMAEAPPMPTAPRPPSMRPPSLQPRASAPAGAPPPLPRAPEPAEPPAMPPGADRFKLDEEPADADETMAPSPRLVAASRPRMDPPPAAAPRIEPAPPAPAPRVEPARVEARPEPAPSRPTPAAPLAAQPIVMAAPPAVVAPAFATVGERAVEPGPLGPFEALLEEVGVLEIVAEGPSRILVDRGNGLVSAGKGFASGDALAAAAARLFTTGGGRLVHGRAVQEASLPDGSHVLAVLPPFAVGGPYVEVRRLGRPAAPGETLVGQGMLSNDMLGTLRSAVAVRRNVVVIGASDAGVPQLVAALIAMSPESERVVCVEASPELALPASRAVRFSGGDALGALIDRAASLRADRLVIDGVTGGHVRAALVALSSRSGGGLLGVRAPSIGPSIEQLASLASLGGTKDGAAALAASACHVIVRMSRGADGVRRVDAISELQGEGLVTLFEHDDGGFASTGARPSF